MKRTHDGGNGGNGGGKRQRVEAPKVYIASMNMRGKWAERPHNSVVLNVTSAQGKTHPDRLAFSPMTPVDGGYKGFWNFESYWQSGKVIAGMDRNKCLEWWKKQVVPRRRYPGSKGKKVLCAQWGGAYGPKLGYVDSRKQVYVPEYYQLIKDRASDRIQHWIGEKEDGSKHIVVCDFDGPRDPESGEPMCLEVTESLLREKLNDPRHPFGHGYIVAGLIAGIEPSGYL